MDYVVKSLKMRAKSGDAEALIQLGKKYASGDGVGQNDGKAEKYFKKAAKLNLAEGFIELGKLYQKVNPSGNLQLCEEVWTKAVSLGSDEARCLIAFLYYRKGHAVRNRDKALEWLKKPAESGYAPAQLALGQLYYDAFEGKERLKCLEWFKKAAESDYAQAQYSYGLLIIRFDTGKSVIEALKEGEEWLTKAAKNGVAEAYEELGNIYAYGGDESFLNPEKAKQCYKKAGTDTATCMLAAYLIDNGEVKRGIAEYERAAENGYTVAAILLGDLYYGGECTERDFNKAFYWYERGYSKYSEPTHFGLGRCYLYGAGTEQNLKKAVKLLNSAARYVPEATYELGNCYFNGWGVNKDKPRARELWRKAAEYESEQAIAALDRYFGEKFVPENK